VGKPLWGVGAAIRCSERYLLTVGAAASPVGILFRSVGPGAGKNAGRMSTRGTAKSPEESFRHDLSVEIGRRQFPLACDELRPHEANCKFAGE